MGSIPGSGRSPGGGLIYIYNMPMRQALLLFSNKKNLKYKITFLTHSIKISGGKKKTIKAAGSYNEIFNKCIHSFNIY